MIYVQFSDQSNTSIISVFAGPQDPEVWPNLGEVSESDPRYLAFFNPPLDYLAIHSDMLRRKTSTAAAQRSALANRILTLSDAVDLEMATAEEIAELPERQEQLVNWKRYAIFLGRVTQQEGWHLSVDWPIEPTEGMDLTVSAVASDSPQPQ